MSERRICRITGCRKPPRPSRRICHMHRKRITKWQDPHFLTWAVADEHDVEVIASERRPVDGLTRLERVLVALRMTERGASAREISEVLRVSERQVHRWLADHRAGVRPGVRALSPRRCAA